MLSDWISLHAVEILGVFTSLVYLYFSVRQLIWLWPFGILSSALFVYIFYHAKFYADMGLQVYYLFISIYGWIYWSKGFTRKERPVRRLGLETAVVSGVLMIFLLLLLVWILQEFTDSDVPWGDAFTTAASIIATWMLARKILEHWLLWIVVDTVAAGLYFYKGLFPSAGLYLIFAGIAMLGYRQWQRGLNRQSDG